MKVFMRFSTIILILITISVNGCGLNGYLGAHEKFERTVELSETLSSGLKVASETSNGSITVTGTENEICHIVATITARSFSVEEAQVLAEQTQIRLDRKPEGLQTVIVRPEMKQNESVSVSFEIKVPRQTALELKTSNGKIQISQIDQAIGATTSNGKIEITSVAGDIAAHTSNGGISIRQATAELLDLHTSNGSIKCEDIYGNMTASTSNGSVNIQYAIDANSATHIRITTSNGGIDLVTPENYSATVDAATSNGKIHAGIPITVQGKIGKQLNGVIGSGEGQLYLRTSNSSITIH